MTGFFIKQVVLKMNNIGERGEVLLDVKGLKIQGFADEKWDDII